MTLTPFAFKAGMYWTISVLENCDYNRNAAEAVYDHAQHPDFGTGRSARNTSGRVRGPRSCPADHVTFASGAIAKSGIFANHSCSATVVSMRAKCEPRQRWIPSPKAAW